MRPYAISLCFYLGAACLFFSCAAAPAVRVPQEGLPPPSTAQSGPERLPPEEPVIPPIPEYIMGRGLTSADQLADFLLSANPKLEQYFAGDMAALYVEEAAFEGVNHDAAFSQMCLETGFLKYGGLVTPEMNNFCGLGSLGPEQPGERFPDLRTGVRAHIQHLKAYATAEPLQRERVDPRYRLVRYGSSPAIKGLAGTWAADLQYAEKITSILKRLYRFSFEKAPQRDRS
ncbi:MAG: glucosaminidase domain-containing protein [Treponema sp.]|jgi:hypothetical protein|nr:glucosaminidase domain-containing protein [Treponema sp.]